MSLLNLHNSILEIPLFNEEDPIHIPLDVLASSAKEYSDRLGLLLCDERYLAGNEGLITLTKNTIYGIGNIISHVLYNFRTLFVSYRDFKRSELRYYNESNVFTYGRVMRLKYSEVKNILVPFPRGLKGTYKDGIRALNSCLLVVNILSKARGMTHFSGRLLKELHTNKKVVKVVAPDNLNLSNQELKRIKIEYENVGKVYTDQRTGDAKFSTLFMSMEEFKNSGDKLLEMEKYYIELSKVHSYIKDVEDNFDKIQSALENQKDISIDRFSLKYLADTARVLATIISIHASCVQDLHRTEHNYLLVVKSLTSAVK